MNMIRGNLAMCGALGLLAVCGAALSAPATYTIDSNHTYPSFSADHMGGLSTWRGKFNKTTGSLVFDPEARTGTVDIVVDVASIDFGMEKMNEEAVSPKMFDVAKYPTAVYKGKLADFKDGKPTKVEGTLTLHGVTKPLTLTINSFLCKQNPQLNKQVCGADAAGSFNRGDFGVDYGATYGFNLEVTLAIQVEGIRADQ